MHDVTPPPILLDSLACAALETGLRSILVFDAPSTGLQQIAVWLTQMLACTTDLPIACTQLSPAARDDDLWGYLPLPGGQDGATTRLVPNLFSRTLNHERLPIILIPDLSRLSLAAARAAIMLIGADVVHLERHGQQECWQPNACWLAACRSTQEEIGAISPHLLDRFALRLCWQDIAPQEAESQQARSADLLTSMQPVPAYGPSPLVLAECQRIRETSQRDAAVTSAALTSIAAYTADLEHATPRRGIALARLARTLARLHGQREMSVEQVERAALMLGLQAGQQEEQARPQTTGVSQTAQPAQVTSDTASAPLPSLLEPELVSPGQPLEDAGTDSTLLASEPEQVAPVASALLTGQPYPEDDAPVAREAASLRLPTQHSTRSRSDRGPVIGVEPSETLNDLALVSTILNAVLFRAVRQPPGEEGRLRFFRSDLRRYRRGAVPEHLLALLLDYTALRECEWQEALLPYLHAAYTNRASIVLIKVGARDAQDLLQADLVSARSLLVPQIARAFSVQHGCATPLAHGLDLALQTLHKALQHGRSAVGRVMLIVLTDGRGNVPLAASRCREITTIVTREGIEDALHVARQIGALNRVESIVLHPPLTACQDLPAHLAQALGGHCEALPARHDGWEAEL